MTTLATWQTERGCYLASDGRATRGSHRDRDDVEKWLRVGDRFVGCAGPQGARLVAAALLVDASDPADFAIKMHERLVQLGWRFEPDGELHVEVIIVFDGVPHEVDVALGVSEPCPTPSFHGSGSQFARAAHLAFERVAAGLVECGIEVEADPGERLRGALEVATEIDLCTGGEITVWKPE